VGMKRDIGSELSFISPDDAAKGKSWDAMETVQPCKGVVGERPKPLDLSGLVPKKYAWSTGAVTLTSDSLAQVIVVGNLAPNDRVEVLMSLSYGVKIESARLGQQEDPLYVVVNGFQLIICPLLNLANVTTATIWFGATVKPDNP
jgi:hypothetical protein